MHGLTIRLLIYVAASLLRAYLRDRRKDQLLQENGDFVLRFLAEDVGKVLDAILRVLALRRQSAASRASQIRTTWK